MRSRFQSEIRIEDLRNLSYRSNNWAHALPLLDTVFCLSVYHAAIFRKAMWGFIPGVRLQYRTSEVALIVSLLAGAVSWVGYTVGLNPMLYERQLNSLTRIGWIILCIPSFVLYWIAMNSPTRFALPGSLYFYGIVLIGASLFYELYQNQENRLVPSGAKVTMAGHSAPLTEPVMEMS